MTVSVKQKNPGWIEKLKLRYKQEPLECAVGYPRGQTDLAGAHYPTNQSAVSRKRTQTNKARKKKGGEANELTLGSGPSILEVAIWNNFGVPSKNIPRRAFMELASNKMQPKFKEMVKKAVKRINSGELKLKTLLKDAGEMGEDEIRKAIMEGDWAKNSPRTIALKGEDTPLRDSGDLTKYATHQVRPRTK
jgi:hypothetical protein